MTIIALNMNPILNFDKGYLREVSKIKLGRQEIANDFT